jgi:hypothetical protein
MAPSLQADRTQRTLLTDPGATAGCTKQRLNRDPAHLAHYGTHSKLKARTIFFSNFFLEQWSAIFLVV